MKISSLTILIAIVLVIFVALSSMITITDPGPFTQQDQKILSEPQAHDNLERGAP